MAKRGKAVPKSGRRLTRAQKDAIRAEQPSPDGLFYLDAIALKHDVTISTVRRHLKPPRAKVIPRMGSKLPPKANALVLRLLKTTKLSYRKIVTMVRNETGVRVSKSTVANRTTNETRRPSPRREKTRHFKTAAAKQRAIDRFFLRLSGRATRRFSKYRGIFTKAGMSEGDLRQELIKRLHDRLDYYDPNNELLERFIRREAIDIGADILKKAKRGAEKSRRLERETQAMAGRRALDEGPPAAPTPFALLGLHHEDLARVPVGVQRTVVEAMVKELKPKRGKREFKLLEYAKMRALDGMTYTEIARGLEGRHISIAAGMISYYRTRMEEFIRAELKRRGI